jgi:hypothetical protein
MLPVEGHPMSKTRRLDNLIAFGEIEQMRRNSVMAHLWLRSDEEIVLTLELTGNLEGAAAERAFRFRANENNWESEPDFEDCNLQLYQQGVVGRCVMTPIECDPDDFEATDDERAELSQRNDFIFEWWSQDGHILLQLEGACIEFEGDYRELEDLIEYEEHTSQTEFDGTDGDSTPEWLRDLPEEATPDNARLGPEHDQDPTEFLPIEAAKEQEAEMTWEEIVESNSPENEALFQEWDEILHGKNHEPVDWLIDDSVRLPMPHQIRDEQEAASVLQKLLSRLAPLGIVLDMCEHVSAFDAYQMMIHEFLPGTHVHPRMGASGFVHHFSTWELCEACSEEMDEEMDEELN